MGGVVAQRPVERYGAPRPWVRPLTVAGVVVLALAAGTWLVWAALRHAQPAVDGRLDGYDVVDGDTVSVTITVQRQAGVGAVCLLEAQAADHFVVGELRATVPPGPREQRRLRVDITTERPATNAVLDGCTALRP